MKKFAAVFAAAVLVFTLFACADRTNLSEEAPGSEAIGAVITVF